jgi:hypothetical protein
MTEPPGRFQEVLPVEQRAARERLLRERICDLILRISSLVRESFLAPVSCAEQIKCMWFGMTTKAWTLKALCCRQYRRLSRIGSM